MGSRSKRSKRVLALTLLSGALAVGPSTIAAAHGELESGTPKEGAVLQKVPKHAYLNFSEAPSDDSVLKVTDGCGRDVVKKLERFDITLHAELTPGQPGTWKMSYDVISDEDGHETEGSYNFKVQGTKDCSQDTASGGTDGTQASGSPLPGEDSSFPVVPVAIGALVLIGGAVAVRTKSSN
ncbi:MAG: copper transport protein [Actinomycetota bacterium]|jgi:methionine-rich copper-binding protein CopC|nr:copper transport protein [Actinomycetota bacterium]